MTHRHLVDGQPNNALQKAWCVCGATYDLTRDRWGEPKYTTGRVRRAQWKPEEGD